MAKGKGAVALFEVIRKDKRFERKSRASHEPPRVDDSRTLAKQAVDLWRKKKFRSRNLDSARANAQRILRRLHRTRKARFGPKCILAYTSSMNFLRLRISQTNGIVPGIGARCNCYFRDARYAALLPPRRPRAHHRGIPPRRTPSPHGSHHRLSGRPISRRHSRNHIGPLPPKSSSMSSRPARKPSPSTSPSPASGSSTSTTFSCKSYFEEKTAKDAPRFPQPGRHPLHHRTRRQRLAPRFLPSHRPPGLRPRPSGLCNHWPIATTSKTSAKSSPPKAATNASNPKRSSGRSRFPP